MSKTPFSPDARPAQQLAEAEEALLSRWPEHKLDPTLERITDFVGLLGDPQKSQRTIHLTGTNGKTSTARMSETLLLGLGLRTGRFTSPHLETIRERIVVDGEPLDEDAFVRAFNDVAPYTHMVDARHDHPLSFFETVVGMAYAAFADAPVDVAVIEVGMGGKWDATNVVDAEVAVLTPIAIDHVAYLGDTPVAIAHEKVGIIKPGSVVVSAAQRDDVAAIIDARAQEVGARVLRADRDFEVVRRVAAVGGQVVTIRTPYHTYEDLFFPLYGAHQGDNAALALVAVEALVGSESLGEEVVREAFAQFSSPGRLEVIRRSPTIVLDAAHNPHGAQATAAALDDSFSFSPLIGVMSVMHDKDYEGVLAAFEPYFAHVVCTQNTMARALPAQDLAEAARGIYGVDRVSVAASLADAIDQATALAEAGGVFGEGIGSGGVLITGSVASVGQARALLRPRGRATQAQ